MIGVLLYAVVSGPQSIKNIKNIKEVMLVLLISGILEFRRRSSVRSEDVHVT
jgi:hypothetical protein